MHGLATENANSHHSPGENGPMSQEAHKAAPKKRLALQSAWPAVTQNLLPMARIEKEQWRRAVAGSKSRMLLVSQRQASPGGPAQARTNMNAKHCQYHKCS